MSGEDTSKIKTRTFFKLAIVLVILAVLAFVVISLISGLRTGDSWFANLFSQGTPELTAAEFSFDVGRDRMFAYVEGAVAAVGTLGVQVLDAAGRETLRDSFRMTQPAVVSNGGRCIAFDIGGSAVRVFNTTQVLASIETSGAIVSASINQNGWFCVVTQEGGGMRGTVTVYNSMGLDVYSVNFGSGFILSAELSPDNRSLAILNLTDYGSRISFYHGIDEDKDAPDAVFDLRGGLIINISYMPSGDILAISTDLLFTVDSDGNGSVLYSFTDKRLGGYTYSDHFIALHLYDYGIGHRGRLVTLLFDGTIVEEMIFDREIISMSAVNNTLTVLGNDGVTFLSYALEELPVSAYSPYTAGARQVIAVSDDAVLAASDNFAVIVVSAT